VFFPAKWPARAVGLLSALLVLALAHPAWAVGGLNNATPIADNVDGIYNIIYWITLVIFVGVWGAMAYVLIRYRYRPDRQAAQFHGSTALEVVWTIIPTIALIVVAIPTYKSIRYLENVPKPDLTVEVVGHQFAWDYKYSDLGVSLYGAPWIEAGGQVNKGDVLVVPARKVVKVLISSKDVVHDWAVPEFGFKLDAIPGHVNQGWFFAKEEGSYQGYCMQLCGMSHAKMLTEVRAVSDAEFEEFIKSKGGKLAPEGSAARAEEAAPAAAVEAAAEVPNQVAAKPSLTSEADLVKHGAEVYQANCASCHQATGEGIAGAFPPLKGSEYTTQGDGSEHVKIVLKGLQGPIKVAGKDYNGVMPAFPQLSDEDIASVVTYERRSWGNQGSVVKPDMVKKLR